MSTSLALSVLDQCPVPTGATAGDVLHHSIDLARHVEALGYRRFWVTEHHNHPGVVASAPVVLAGQVAAATTSIRVGSGGVMLPNHAPIVVAEQFGTLEALYPGRIDLGIGRAPGTDEATARALRRHNGAITSEDFPQELETLLDFFAGTFPDGHPYQGVRAIPAEGNKPAFWLLGSSEYSARLAGRMGLPFAFAHHFNPEVAESAMASYRRAFRPSAELAQPTSLISVAVVCADDTARAQWLHGSLRLWLLPRRTGRPRTLPSPQEAAAFPFTDADRAEVAKQSSAHVVGDAATVLEQLGQLAARTGADEVMITTIAFSHHDRLRSYELLAEATGMSPSTPSSA